MTKPKPKTTPIKPTTPEDDFILPEESREPEPDPTQFSFINDGIEDSCAPSAKHQAEEEAANKLSLGGITAERMPTENEAPEGFIPQTYLTGDNRFAEFHQMHPEARPQLFKDQTGGDDTADALHYAIESTNFYLFGNKIPEFYRDHNGSIQQIPETPEGKEDFLAKYSARAIEALKRQDKRDICQYCDKRRGRSCRFKHTCRAHFGIKPEA